MSPPNDGIGSYAKAIATGVMALFSVLAIVFHTSLPEWLTEDWVLAILAVLTPIAVVVTPNEH